MALFQVPFIVNFFWSMRHGQAVGRNPWNATTLEWAAESPPPHQNFARPPAAYRGPYEYQRTGRRPRLHAAVRAGRLMETPYATEVRPDTGLSNGTLAMWLFLASEAMFFAALFSGYALLRTGSAEWPRGAGRLGLTLASVNTLLLTASSITMIRGGRAAAAGDRRRARRLLAVSALLGLVFLGVKAYEWSAHLRAGELPSSDTFMAIYYTLTGVHALHVLGGVAALAYLSGTALRDEPAAGRYAARVRLSGLYWLFVEAVWLILFVTVYLL